MCHSDRVAKKCYIREDMTTTAASAMDIISMCTLSENNYHPDPNIVAKPRSVECAVNPSSNAQSSNANESMLQFADDNNIQTREVISSPNEVNPSCNRQSSNANESVLQCADDNNIQTREVISNPNEVNPSCNRQSSNANESVLQFADDNNIQTREVIFSPNEVNPSCNRQSSNANESVLQFADDSNIRTVQVISNPKAVNVAEKKSPAGPGGKSPEERKLSSKEEGVILNVYDDLIKSRDQIVTDHVRSLMKHDPSLRVLVPIPGMVKKVVDRIRYLQHKKGEPEPAMRPDDLPETQVEEETQKWLRSVDSSSSDSSTRMLWSSEETAMILKHFGDLVKNPSKIQMQEAFNTIDELAPLLKVKGFQRCVDKVRNTRRSLKKNKAASN